MDSSLSVWICNLDDLLDLVCLLTLLNTYGRAPGEAKAAVQLVDFLKADPVHSLTSEGFRAAQNLLTRISPSELWDSYFSMSSRELRSCPRLFQRILVDEGAAVFNRETH